MKTKRISIRFSPVIWFAALVFVLAPTAFLVAEDTDVYRTSVKSNAMLTIDVSGSMAWPVYDHEMDYKAFYDWAIDNGYAHNDGDLDENGKTGIFWDKNKIYLVSAYIGYAEITGEDGITKYSVVGDPVYPGSSRRQKWVTGGIIDTGWEITDWDTMSNTIETVDDNGQAYVVYPTRYDDTKADNGQDLRWGSTVAYARTGISGHRLLNHQDIVLTDIHTDTRTGVSKDYGFLGRLKAPGIYFAGLFETGTYYTLTDDPTHAATSGGLERVYAFVTGNYLSFIKLIEDLNGDGSCGNEAWRYLCYQPGSRVFNTVDIGNIHNSEYSKDYSSGLDENCGTIDLQQYTGRRRLMIYFSDLDVENSSGGGGCSCWNNNSDNDGVYLVDQDGNVLKQITEQISETAGGYMFGCEDQGWTGEYDVTDVDTITVMFHTGPNGADNCSDYDRGFVINRFKWTTQVDESTPTGGLPFSCCNGSNGVGQKIRSRLEVAQEAMKVVIHQTIDKINWGLVSWSGSGIHLREQMGAGEADLDTAIDALTAGGGTPMGEAMQDTYDFMYDFLENNTATAGCSNNYMVVLTDGFPSGDTEWHRIDKNSHNPNFTDSQYDDGDGWTGDPTQTTAANHSDDVARWMARGKCAESSDTTGYDPDYNVITHTIGLGLDSPLLVDTADEGCGESLVANNRAELINAFYSLGLAMEPAVAFTAPVVSVDEANRTQSGENVYMAFFKPQSNDYWQGNMKKYGLDYLTRTECNRNSPEWTVVDKNGNTAGECDGSFKSSSISYWSGGTDGGVVDAGGVGGKLLDAIVAADMENDPYGFRRIYTTLDDSTFVPFTPDNLTNADLDVSDDEDRYKIVNFMYGYTYDVDSATMKPVARRDWILGDIIHSSPVIIDYTSSDSTLEYRYIAVASNDGMIHIFADQDYTVGTETYEGGEEIFAFVPKDLLPKLKNFENSDTHYYTVDGSPRLVVDSSYNDDNGNNQRDDGEYYGKTLIFGERRGGRNYWALDVTNPDPDEWTIKWHIDNTSWGFSELAQTWSKPYPATIKTEPAVSGMPGYEYKHVLVFTGGYDTLEDGYPEDFTDDDYDGIHDPGEAFTDTAGGTPSVYDKFNPDKDTMGRGIFVVDMNGAILFSATYGTTDVTTGGAQTYSEMKYCFPADPTVIPLSKTELLIYAADIYGQVWKITYDYYGDAESSYDYTNTTSTKWQVKRIFAANPGSTLTTGNPDILSAGVDSGDAGRKMFYSPDVSFRGNCWIRDNMLYFGTGDREHPRYSMTSNRFYAVADTDELAVETDLLNLTCNELDEDADSNGDGTVDGADELLKAQLKCAFYSDRTWDTTGNICKYCKSIDNGTDCHSPCQWDSVEGACNCPDTAVVKGFYRILDQQGNCVDGSAVDHNGEKILSRPVLFYKNVYFTSYQPVYDDPCNPNGNAFVYALNYCWGTSGLNYNSANDPAGGGASGDEETRNLSDTFRIINNASIPSGVKIFMRNGKPAAMFSAGGGVPGAGEGGSTEIPGPPGGINRMLWETDN